MKKISKFITLLILLIPFKICTASEITIKISPETLNVPEISKLYFKDLEKNNFVLLKDKLDSNGEFKMNISKGFVCEFKFKNASFKDPGDDQNLSSLNYKVKYDDSKNKEMVEININIKGSKQSDQPESRASKPTTERVKPEITKKVPVTRFARHETTEAKRDSRQIKSEAKLSKPQISFEIKQLKQN